MAYDLDPTSAEAAAIRAVILAAKPARKELQRLAKLCGIKANMKNTVILEELEQVLAGLWAFWQPTRAIFSYYAQLDAAQVSGENDLAAFISVQGNPFLTPLLAKLGAHLGVASSSSTHPAAPCRLTTVFGDRCNAWHHSKAEGPPSRRGDCMASLS